MTIFDVEVISKNSIYFLQVYADGNNTPGDFEVSISSKIIEQFSDPNAKVKLLCTSYSQTHFHINVFTENPL